MKYSHRFFLYAPVAALAALAAAVALYWSVSAQAFSKMLDELNGREAAPGVTIHFASRDIGGFPFRIDAVLTDLRVDVAGAHGPAAWRTEKFALHMLDYSGATVVFEAAGKQRVSWHDAAGAAHALAFVPALLRASARSGGGRLKRFDLELAGAALPAFSVARSELHLRRDPKADAFDLAAMADDVHLSPDQRTALGDVISRVRLDATLVPAGDWDALFAGTSDWRKAADGWRAHSGALDIDKLEVAWGKADAKGSGLLMLDSAHRPRGEIKLTIAGYQALADEAARRAPVKGTPESLLAGMMAEAASSARNPAGELPITLAFKDGLGYVNRMPADILSPVY